LALFSSLFCILRGAKYLVSVYLGCPKYINIAVLGVELDYFLEDLFDLKVEK